MKVKKAVVTAAGPDHHLPLQRLVDRHGQEKTALQLILDEVGQAGIDEIAVIVRPGDSEAFRAAAGDHAARLTFIEQTNPRGYGDAIHRAAGFVGREPFLHLVGDHLYRSGQSNGAGGQCCAAQLVKMAENEECSVSAVQATRENMLPYFGTIGGRRVARHNKLYEVSQVIEKPTPTEAEQKLHIAGLRAGYYLCMFGMHVLTPQVMMLLADALARRKRKGCRSPPPSTPSPSASATWRSRSMARATTSA